MSGVDLYAEPQPHMDVKKTELAIAGRAKAAPAPQSSAAGPVSTPIRSIRKGAAESVAKLVKEQGGRVDQSVMIKVDEISRQGGTPLLVADGARLLGVIQLKDIVKGGIRERFAQLRKMGITTVMITGDNPLTAAAIAAEAAVWMISSRHQATGPRTNSLASAKNGRAAN